MALASSSAGADVSISYDSYCDWNNAMYNLSGLDIASAKSCKASVSADELTNGAYKLEVDYLGDKSTAKILNTNGDTVSELDNVDLSGSGVATLSFDCGVELSINKTETAGSTYDKYDYADKGAAVLFADIDYTRINTYNLAGSQTATDRSASLSFAQGTKKDSAGGTFSICSAGLGAVDSTTNELSSGTYSVQVYKTANTVSGIMYDTDGNVVGSASATSLDTDGSTTMDFGNGVVMNVDDSNYSGNTTMTAVVDYKKATNAYDDFDFSAYTDKITAAEKTVTEQQKVISDASSLTTTASKALAGTLSGSVFSTTNLLITNLLGGDTTYKSVSDLLTGASSDTTGLGFASSMIMSNLSTSLGVDSESTTSLTSLLSGTTASLDPSTLPAKLTYAHVK